MKKLGLCLAVLLLTALCAQAARVDTLSVASPKMKRNIPVVVIVPEQALAGNSCPTLYLLHGHGGNAFTWPTIKPELPQMADRDGIIVVCPDGEASWYWDSPLRPESQFETFVARELTAWIDSRYPTIKDRKGRAITGLSMGGHGSLWLSFRHKDLFGAAGSTSGGDQQVVHLGLNECLRCCDLLAVLKAVCKGSVVAVLLCECSLHVLIVRCTIAGLVGVVVDYSYFNEVSACRTRARSAAAGSAAA